MSTRDEMHRIECNQNSQLLLGMILLQINKLTTEMTLLLRHLSLRSRVTDLENKKDCE